MAPFAPKHALADMTFVEFGDRLAERPVVLLPFGSQEEQGPHAPMGDWMLTRDLAAIAAERAGAIVAPTVPFGHADFFRTIPGGIQLRASTFIALVEDVVTAFLDHGVEHLLIFNGHSSNAPLIEQALRGIRRERGVAVPCINVWRSLPDSLWRQLYGEDVARARGHGGEPMTSVYMHLYPERVRPDLVRPSGNAEAFGLPTSGVSAVTFEGMPIQVPLDVTEVNRDGMMGGDPTLASAEKGAAIVEHIASFTTRFIDHIRRCDPRRITTAPVP
ncbi:creatininase family protein [Marinivivus vitaminiproducens]|uniref:creatininase family protein n=1 Tax=Marinivivus vitaminiproducens TaxID=3035935 RepID=UPI00279B09DC|nr:creatininase family protein [Geminicoccaceae bacterium SCSIO 64248]